MIGWGWRHGRRLALAAFMGALVAGSGCASTSQPPPPAPADAEPGLAEVGETAEALKVALATYPFPESVKSRFPGGIPRCRLLSLRNETDSYLKVDRLTDRIRGVVESGGKVAFVTESDRLPALKSAEDYEKGGESSPPPATPAYVVRGRMKNARTADGSKRTNTITVTLELLDQATEGTLLEAKREFRYVRE
jgi:hypothetical protein